MVIRLKPCKVDCIIQYQNTLGVTDNRKWQCEHFNHGISKSLIEKPGDS